MFIVVLLVLNLLFGAGRSVTNRKGKDQATIDKEVLLEDEDYDDDDDVLNLTPEEQKERLQKLVERKIDANKDGFVDLQELQAWCVKAFDQFETDDIDEEFEIMDTNKDGSVTWQEFVADMFGNDFSETETDKKTRLLYKKDKKLFTAADTNSDEKLDLTEYMIFRIPRKKPEMRRIVLEDTLENHDLDKDSTISMEEFLKGSHDDDDKDFGETDLDRFRDDFDEDGNGVLTNDEIFRWVDPDNREDAYDEADHLMSECDLNNDEKLSAEEILSNHDLWVESDATDYGKKLLMDHDEF